MADVFVSYARPDELDAKRVADALRRAGFSVWRDDELPAHRAYADVIQERLNSSKAVVVLWSPNAAKSQWVRAEADAARLAGTLVQVTLDGSLPPLPFNQIQCADLRDWNGNGETDGWRKLAASVAELAGNSARPEPARPAPRRFSICVLPFVNMSGDAEQEYFSDGISEDITTDLSKVSALSVIARNTAFTFKGQAVDICDVARKLGVHHVLEGSVRKAGGRVRITAQLIDGRTGGHVWAERYDRDLTDIFALQDEISKAIVDALKVRLLADEKKAIENRGTTNADAYNLFLMARQAWVNGTHGDARREETVIRMCGRIIEMEPNYGRAWALKALAQAYLFFGYNKGGENGVRAADRALELDPGLPEPYCVKARAAAASRNFEEAEKQIEIALKLAPDLWEVQNEAAATFIWQRKYREAIPHYERCIELTEDDRHSCDMLGMAYRALNDQAGSRRAATKLLELAQAAIEKNPSDNAAFGSGANALVMLGDLDRARGWMERALLLDPDNLNMRYNFACTLLGYSDDHDTALDHIDYVFTRSVGSIVRRADMDSDLDPVRDSPRFQAIYEAAKKRIACVDAEEEATAASGEPLRS
ncbi:TIR domain-containing protein [Sphingomonas sp. SM33]|uniref:TIR domain-containing protein n=1 Tax=Sphingomonas telluris TaxID=2907998 RepID=A0ABS9VJC4_9SPHN|nr:TIR domain-containing protein [Sphingomonas telluris]MCH8615076.1 TIR domain-containing protein [Sphingomonas telluris]